jgi:prepilin-type N-terminal cleavage/methylation domain-containing protein
MKKLIRRIFGSRHYKRLLAAGKKNYIKGFTLVELLVAMVITSVIVAVMLTFLVGVLDSDRKEQAKSESQEEMQSAINYIADDLQEAIYIYDATALAAIDGVAVQDPAFPTDPTKTINQSQLPHQQTNDSCTKDNGCTPILVFWKRYVYDPTSKTGSKYHGCMPYVDTGANYTSCIANSASAPLGGDNFTFSLVAYYLKSDVADTAITTPTWSKTARILRWELKDGYRWYCADGTACTPKENASGNRTSTNTAITPTLIDKNAYFVLPDKGFNRPDFLSAGTLSQNAAKWRKFEPFDFSTNKFTTLVDFVDDTKYDNSSIKIAVDDVNSTTAPFSNPDCADPTIGVGVSSSTMVAQRIPSDFSNATSNPSQLTSFYVCVAPEQVTARIYLRGNAIARVQPNRLFRTPNDNNLTFFPTINVRAFGRSSLGLNKKSS